MTVSTAGRCVALNVCLCALLSSTAGRDGYAGTAPSDPMAARGEQIARQICSACHIVAADQQFPPLLRDAAPGFSAIANRPATTAKSLQRFITATHWDTKTIPMSMPNPMLMPDQVLAVSRYILSLRKP